MAKRKTGSPTPERGESRPKRGESRPERGEIRCESGACRRAVRLLAVPVTDGQDRTWAELRIRGGAQPRLLKRCPWCGTPFGRLRWEQWRLRVFRETMTKKQAAQEQEPLPEEIIARATAVRRGWCDERGVFDPVVMKGRKKAFATEAARQRAREEG